MKVFQIASAVWLRFFMFDQGLLERKYLRFEFLNKLNDVVEGDVDKFVNGCEVAKKIESETDLNKIKLAAKYLKDEHLVEETRIVTSCPIGVIKLTHYGIKELEGAIENPDESSKYFEPVNVMYQHISINDSTGVQIGNNNSQSIAIDHNGGTDTFRDIESIVNSKIQNGVEKEAILFRLRELELAVGSSNFSDKYKDFMANLGSHVTVLGSAVSALAVLG